VAGEPVDCAGAGEPTAMEKVANRNAKVWHGATEEWPLNGGVPPAAERSAPLTYLLNLSGR
jgi:hypothetical protein